MELSKRMKNYETVSKNFLTRRVPVIIRIDGKAFHTFTKNFRKPFDSELSNCMGVTMVSLCQQIQNCVLGYTQSDEITLVLIDDKTKDTCAWFNNNVQKITSVSASMATLAFNQTIQLIAKYDTSEFSEVYENASKMGALFDSRAFNIPKEEVANCLIWRQQDATKNSIQMLARSFYSHTELMNKNINQLQDMLMTEKGVNWNNIPTKYKRGFCAKKSVDKGTGDSRDNWVCDYEIPIFTQNRYYIEKLL